MNKLKRARLLKGLTQKELADLLGVSIVSVSKWESGKGRPKARRLNEVASTLNISIQELLDETERRPERGKIAQCG